MGRPRKPLAAQSRHNKVVEIQRRQLEESLVACGAEQLEKPPAWLTDAKAKKEWKRLVEELKKIGIIGNLDLNHLGAYCNAYAAYLKATKELKASTLTIERETKTGKQVVENPLINIQKKYSEEMRRYAALCGLTMDARLKAGAAKADQKEEEIRARFGGIL